MSKIGINKIPEITGKSKNFKVIYHINYKASSRLFCKTNNFIMMKYFKFISGTSEYSK